MAEQDITGGVGGERGSTPISSSFKFNVPGLSQTTGEIRALNTSLTDFKSILKDLGTQNSQIMQGFNQMMSDIRSQAGSVQSMLGGSGSMGYRGATAYSTSAAYGGGGIGGASTAAAYGIAGGGGQSLPDMIGRMVTTPLKYMYERVEENRAVSQGMAQALGPVATLSGNSIYGIIQSYRDAIPVAGSMNDILTATNIGAQTGYGNMSSGRAGNYFTALRQMQQFTPAVGAGQLAEQFSSYLGNTQSQQRSLFLTGGAMSAFGPGGAPKTLADWAESILKFFQSQRPGKDRGKAFTKEQLETQMFPGSNMDAWFSVNAVPDYMRQYFWQYAIGKAATGATGSGDDIIRTITAARGGDLAQEMLQTASAASRRDFHMATTTPLPGGRPFYNQYVQREGVDRQFLDALRFLDTGVNLMTSPFQSLMAIMPTPLAGALAQIGTDAGSMAVSSMSSWLGGKLFGAGDPEMGVGDYGPYGGTSTAGMDPSMARKIQSMMQANPRLRIVSGFRDGALQGRLHSAGVGRVGPAGKGSSHGKGWAADLGPASEYGWIMANAGKFGLHHAGHVGEPWHVGLPGTVPHGGRRGMGDPEWGIGDSWWDSLPSPGGMIDFVQGKANNVGMSMVSGGLDVAGFGKNMMQALGLALGGDLSALFGNGGQFPITQTMGNLTGGIFNLLGLPSGLNPFSKNVQAGNVDVKKLIGSFVSLLGGGPFLNPLQDSSVDYGSLGQGMGGAAANNYLRGASSGVAGIIQKYGGGRQVAPASIAGREQAVLTALQAGMAAGFSGDELVALGALAGRESGWNARAFNGNSSTKDLSYGLWQINMRGSMGADRRQALGISSNDALYDPTTNARAAKMLYDGSNDPFYHWGPYKGQPALYNAQQYVEPVYNLAKQWGLIGDPFLGGGEVPPSMLHATFSPNMSRSMVSAPVIVENHFTIQTNGSLPDARRITAVIADNLQDELDKRMSRRA